MASRGPTFKEISVLTRYIHPEFRGKNNRPKPSAYQRSHSERYLSVNSLEIHSLKQVAAIYADIFENENRPVALTQPSVSDYNGVAGQVGVIINYNASAGYWEFHESDILTPAYLHHARVRNESHCGVEFVRVFDDFQEFRFAGRMARSKTYKFV